MTSGTRAVLVALLLAIPLTAGAHSIAADEGFVPRPTCRTTAPGAFNTPSIWSCGRVPAGPDWVQIDHAVTLSSSITIWTLYVSQAGSLTNSGTGFTITISDTAPADAQQFDTGIIVEGRFSLIGTSKTAWTTTTAGIDAGATSFSVMDCLGWNVGDRVLLTDTREVGAYPVPFVPGAPEVRTIAGLNGCTVILDRPAGHVYTTARDHDGVVERTVPVGNLTRDITIRSANPAGRRGHLMFTGMATVDIQYVDVADMGRTTIAPLDTTTNVKGRYPFHLHHLMTPRAATIVGNVVERSMKWGYTVHGSNANTLRDNIAYDTQGWGFGTEDGTETDNVFHHNLSVLTSGGGKFDAGPGHAGGPGANGTGFWMQGPRNIMIGNVAMNSEQAGFALWDTLQPPRVLNVFRDNEAIGNIFGLSLWGIGAADAPSVLEHVLEWHNAVNGLYDYASRRLVFTDFYSRSDPSSSVASGTRALAKYNWFGDYDPGLETLFTRPNIQNKDIGLLLPYGIATPTAGPGERVVTITDGYFYNTTDVMARMGGLSAGAQPVRTQLVRPIHGNPGGVHYDKAYLGTGDLTLTNRIHVFGYQGAPGANFEVWGASQDPTFLIPQTATGVTGCPAAGMTNQQCRAAHGVSIFGELMPATATSRANISGKVTPLTVPAPASAPARSTSISSNSTIARSATTTPPLPRSAPSGWSVPPTGDGAQAIADYSAMPICTTVGPTAMDKAGRHWSIGTDFKLMANGIWTGSRGYVYITTPEGLFTIGVNGRLYQFFEPGNGAVRYFESLGCRMPPSDSGATVRQQNGYLVDTLGGVWIATCSYTTFATYCPDFEGAAIEAGVILRNGFRFPESGVRSMAEPHNAPWNLRSCGGEIYVHLFNADPAIHGYARWQGPGEPAWAPALETDCGSRTTAATLSAPTHVHIVSDK